MNQDQAGSPSGSRSRGTPSCSAAQKACSRFDLLVCADTRLMSTMSGLQHRDREKEIKETSNNSNQSWGFLFCVSDVTCTCE